MQTAIQYKVETNEHLQTLKIALVGAALITLGSLIKIPMTPVPFTLQTLAIYILALTQTPKRAFAGVICYLLCATVGLPVLCGHANPLWIIGKNGGYLVAFPLAAYSIAWLRQKYPAIVALLIGKLIILVFGFVWLVPFVGYQIALIKGVLIFIPSDFFKMMAAICLAKGRSK